jgi:Flp pilus assembly protein TadB
MLSKKKPSDNRLFREMREAGLEPKKECLSFFLFVLAIAGFAVYAYLVSHSLIAAFSLALVGIVGGYFLLSRSARILGARHEKDEQEFVRIFAYFSIFVRDGIPVYSALEDTIRYAESDMSKKLRRLLSEIDADKSVAPFVRFASAFPSLEIQQVMISIYKMVDEGGGEAYLRQFTLLFDSLAEDKRKSLLLHKEEEMQNLSMLPLLASGLTMGLITIALIVIMGGIVNGL